MRQRAYKFTFNDFRIDRKLSRCLNEPPIARYIRWLNIRIAKLLPDFLEAEQYRLCSDWWEQLVSDEFILQQDAGFCPHAIYDLEAEDESVVDRFSSDIPPITFKEWSENRLNSETPNPLVKRKTKQNKEIRLCLHEMLALIAQSELDKACQVLVKGSSDIFANKEWPENINEVMLCVAGAIELINRAELHSFASMTKQTCFKESDRHLEQCHEGIIIVEKNSLTITFMNETKNIYSIARKGNITNGYSYLIELLRTTPHRPIEMLSLACNFWNTIANEDEQKTESAKYAVKEKTLYTTTSEIRIAPEWDNEYNKLKTLEEKRDKYNPILEAREREDAENEIAKFKEILIAKYAKSQCSEKELNSINDNEKECVRSVGRALKNTIDRISKVFPNLGKHLLSSIPQFFASTIQYSPVNPHNIKWIIKD